MIQGSLNKCWFVLALVLLQSCSDTAIYDKSFSFEAQQWTQGSNPRFVVPISDTAKSYDIEFTLRTSTDYPFSNIWMNVTILFPDGTKLRKPYELKITDQKGWLGEKSGTMVSNKLAFPNTKLPQKGKYVFMLEQATPEQMVIEVLDIGLRVTQHEKKAVS